MENDIKEVLKRYDEAISFLICNDERLFNPKRAFLILSELSDEGFSKASQLCGIMLCMGIGVAKDFDKGKKMLLEQEEVFGYKTEALLEQCGMYNELSAEEQLKCMEYWKDNHQIRRAMYLQASKDKG